MLPRVSAGAALHGLACVLCVCATGCADAALYTTVGLTQRYFIVQLWVHQDKAFSVELGLSDHSGTRRRILVSSAFKDVVVNPLHAQMPADVIPRARWVNLCFDLGDLTQELFSVSEV